MYRVSLTESQQNKAKATLFNVAIRMTAPSLFVKYPMASGPGCFRCLIFKVINIISVSAVSSAEAQRRFSIINIIYSEKEVALLLRI